MNRWLVAATIGAVFVCAIATWLLVSLVIAAGVGVYALNDPAEPDPTSARRAQVAVLQATADDPALGEVDRESRVAGPGSEQADESREPSLPQAGASATPTTATTPSPGPTPTLPPPVNFPKLPDLTDREPIRTTASFEVFADDPSDPLLLDLGERWAPELEGLLLEGADRVGQGMNAEPVDIVFARRYEARCPARGLAAPLSDEPFIAVYVDEMTTDVQMRAVLAHEIGHHLTVHRGFVGDGVLTEGIASWAAEDHMLEWLAIPSWEDAVLEYLASGEYVSITDDSALSPRGDEDCLERRDRVYTIRTAFVSWLVDRYGLDTVLRMPSRRVDDPNASRDRDRPNGGGADGGGDRDAGESAEYESEGRATIEVPDYETVTGMDLDELEELWLTELREGD